MNNQWVKSGNSYYIREVSQNAEKLPVAIFKLERNPGTGELYLDQVMDKYDFQYKIYGIETKFIDRVKRTYDNTGGNLGILLNGVKGTGKTVTSKQICNELNLPVIIIHAKYEGIPDFVNNLQQDIIIFVDEFEKIYSDRDHSVLTIMDGAMDNGFRKVFLLTTNELYINSNMIQRPGRIRYLKTFKDLNHQTIMEIVDDKLIHTKWREQTIQFISQLETITVDIVKATVDEVNIHNEDPKDFQDIFNIKILEDRYNVFEIIPGNATPVLVAAKTKVFPSTFSQNNIGGQFMFDGDNEGEIISVEGKNSCTTSTELYDDKTEKYIPTTRHFIVEEVKQYHSSFAF